MRFLLSVFILTYTCSVYATSSDDFSFEKIKKIIDQNSHINSVDSLLSYLPENFRNRFVLMHTSGSLHKDCVTSENPRVIFYNEDASVILAAANPNNDPNCRSKMVEVIEYKKNQARFEFHSIEFSDPGIKPVISEANPARCLTCHSNDPHPFWGSYFIWPGAYGGLDDSILESRFVRPQDSLDPLPLETIAFENFMKEKRSQGIYKNLIWKNGRDILNMGRPNTHVSRPANWSAYSAFYRPNFALQLELTKKNRERISRLIKSDPEYLTFRDAIYYAQSCEKTGDGVYEIIQALPPGPKGALEKFPIPRSIPKKIRDNYTAMASKGNWGHFSDLAAYNPFVAKQVEGYEKAMTRLELGIPRRWWGYLKNGEKNNPSNTDLPRSPDDSDWDNLIYSAQIVSPIEFFLSIRGLSMKNWPLAREGYIGTDHEVSVYRYLPYLNQEGRFFSCSELKKNAVTSITSWWQKGR